MSLLCPLLEHNEEKIMRNAMFKMLESYESTLKVMAEVPHYKFVAQPVYRLFGGNRYPLFSVPATFFVMDALFHQVPANLVRMLLVGEINPYFSTTFSMLWVSLSIPIALHKHWKNKSGVESEPYDRLATSMRYV